MRTVIKTLIFLMVLQLSLAAGSFDEFLYKHSFVATDDPKHRSALKLFDTVLEKDNSMKKGYRPIFIKEADWLKPGYLGLAFSTPFACVIFMNTNIEADKMRYDSIVVHEILHCLGYGHHPNPHDIMFAYSMNEEDQYVSSYWYLSEIKKHRFPSPIQESK